MRQNCKKKYWRVAFFNKPVVAMSLFATSLILFSTGWAVINPGKGESWEPLRWSNKSSSSSGHAKIMVSKVEEIIKMFQKAAPLNSPKGFGIDPRGEFQKRFNLPNGKQGLEPVLLRLGVRIPATAKVYAAGTDIWINDPKSILGEPALTDAQGEIFVMPPKVGLLGGQTIYSRSAHPSGYEEKYPSKSFFPLWGHEVEPFLRSVVRPTFKLEKATVTTMFTAGGKPFWKPVSQERWIMAMIELAKRELADFDAGLQAAQKMEITSQQVTQMRDYLKKIRILFDEESIIERHNKSLEQSMSLYEMMKKMNPEEAQKFHQQTIGGAEKRLEEELEASAGKRVELDEYEKKLIQALVTREDAWTSAGTYIKNGDWNKLQELGKKYDIERLDLLADAGRAISKLQAELKSLSAAQRNAPAYGFELPPWHPVGPHKQVVAMPFDAKRPSGLVNPTTKGARALVCLDPDFFVLAEKNSSIRLLAVEWWGSHETRYHSGKMLDDLWKNLDWRALEGMIE
jgi:hypothetical protein